MKKYFSFISAFIVFASAFFVSCPSSSVRTENTDFPEHLLEYVGSETYKSPNNVEINSSSVQNQSSGLKDSWWRETNFYHIWVKSFYDSDGDNCGDFKGIEQKLSYIKDDLGCDGIWLSPIFDCDGKSKADKENMHGYDVKDYYAVNDYFGTEDDLISLIKACHDKGIKIIFDFVPNHTGSGNEWFSDSCKNQNGKKDWYMWSDKQLSQWNTGMGGGTGKWNKNPSGNDYYYSAFYGSQPDLNYRNYEVREEMKNVVRYWLNKGFDGVRIDAVRYLVETEDAKYDTDETHEWFEELRSDVIDKYAENGLSPKFMICEAWITNDRARLEKYFGSTEKPEFNMVFDFDQGLALLQSVSRHKDTELRSLKTNPSGTQTYGTFIANHDNYINRIGSALQGSLPKEKLLTAMSLLRPTTPFIYYGNEIGMKDDTSYGDGDIRHRTKFDWTEAEKQKTNASSILNMNKAILTLRKTYPNLFANGTLTFLESDDNSVSAYTISDSENSILCVFNLNFEKETSDFTFTKTSSLDVSKYSVLVGLDTGKTLSEENGKIKITNLSCCEARVYLLGTDGEKTVFEDARSSDDTKSLAYDPINAGTLYLRGSFNGWGSDWEMGYDSNSKTFGIGLKVNETGTYQFKFDTDGNWTKAYGSGEENANGKMVSLNERVKTSTKSGNNTNFAFTATSTTTWYTFIFYTEDQTFEIVTYYSYD